MVRSIVDNKQDATSAGVATAIMMHHERVGKLSRELQLDGDGRRLR